MAEVTLPAGAVRQLDGSVIYPLAHPVKVHDVVDGKDRHVEVSEVRVRRLKGKDQRFATKNVDKPDLGFLLLERLTGLSQDQIDEIDGEDLDALESIVEGFSPPGRATGKTSSEI
jgi:hypothetical protein